MKDTFSNIWTSYRDRISFLFGSNELRTNIRSIAIIVWLISFLIILPLHRLSLRKTEKSKKNLIESVDELIYLLSKAQYKLSEEQTLKYDPCFALMKTMFDSWHFEYLNNLDTIKENVKKVEALLHQSVISEEKWKKISKQKNSLKTHIFWNKFLGYELNIVTFGLYNLAR